MIKDSVGKLAVRKMVTVLAIGVYTCAIPLTCFGAEKISKWRIEAGPSYRGNMETGVKGESRARSAFVKATQPAQSIPSKAKGKAKGEMDFPNPDDITRTDDRDFDDGFVYTDDFTASDNLTVNFGYQNNSQNDPATGVLTFHRKNEVSDSVFLGKGTEYRKTVRTNNDESFSDVENFGAGGLKVDALYDLASRGGFKFALTAGLRGFFGMDSSMRGSNFGQTIHESRISFRDYYDYTATTNDRYTFLYDNEFPIPPAPYSNTDGNPLADPLINNIPDSATRDISVIDATRRDYRGRQMTVWETANQIEIDTDVDLFQLALGGGITYEIATAVALSLRPLLLVNLISVDVTRNEELVGHYPSGEMRSLGSWQDKESSSSVCLGAAVEAGVNVKLSESWFAGITAGYEWIDDTSVTVGPNKINIDLSGFTTSFIIGVRF